MDTNKELKTLVRELFSILESVEESDSGTEFHPTTIRSCRAAVTARLNELLPRMKELVTPSIDRWRVYYSVRGDRGSYWFDCDAKDADDARAQARLEIPGGIILKIWKLP